ncbi:MAG: class I SAM-dependent methyltransferase [Blastocatellia bacterium]|nr:class I SAM-dependent methyltransferase [Blastocatellia bacterium]
MADTRLYSDTLTGRLERKLLRSFHYRSRSIVSGLEIAAQELYLRRIGLAHARRIPTYTSRSELRVLFRLASWMPVGAGVLEIGSYTGASACYLAAGALQVGGHVYCVDTWGNETMPEGERDTFAEFSRNLAAVREMVSPLRMHSARISAEHFRHPLHLIFIDGSHEYEQVAVDFRIASELLARGGILALHDCVLYPGVSRVIGEALASGDWVLGGLEGNLLWMYRARWEREASATGNG